jgi:hypothetical protein
VGGAALAGGNGMNTRHIIPISGKDSLATAIWQTSHEPALPYEFVFNDTRAELPDTYDWLEKVERTLGIKINRIGKSLKQIIQEHGILPTPRVRFCTERAKIRPMNRYIGDGEAVVYFGLRADEPDRNVRGLGKLQPRFPLKEAGIGLAMVYRLVESRGLMPPAFFWQRLWDEVTRQVGEPKDWLPWMVARVFAWRSRPNCFFCFFQRRYEWVGLLWHHPELFAEAEQIERFAGDGPQLRREEPINWIAEDYPLSRIRSEAETIFRKRVDAVCRLIDKARQSELFGSTLDELDIAGTSCGLLCGK